MEGATAGIDPQTEKEQIAATRISMLGAVVLFLISAVVGFAIDSITMILDAAASLVTLAVSFFMNVSVKKIHSPPDGRFNFGYGKYEPLTLAVHGGLMIATCAVSIKFAFQDILHPDDVLHYGIPMAATFISGVIGMAITGYLKVMAKRTRSRIVAAASLHWFSDTLLALGVCVGFSCGFVLQGLGYSGITPYIDPVMAIVLAVILIRIPLKGIKHEVLELLDAVPPEDVCNRIANLVEASSKKLHGVHRLRVRKAGERIFVEVCFIVKSDAMISNIREVEENLEQGLKALAPVSDLVVSFKPH